MFDWYVCHGRSTYVLWQTKLSFFIERDIYFMADQHIFYGRPNCHVYWERYFVCRSHGSAVACTRTRWSWVPLSVQTDLKNLHWLLGWPSLNWIPGNILGHWEFQVLYCPRHLESDYWSVQVWAKVQILTTPTGLTKHSWFLKNVLYGQPLLPLLNFHVALHLL